VRWRDALALAGRSVQRRSGRATLSILAVALATALLTALLAVARTAEHEVLDELTAGGSLAGIQVVPATSPTGEIDVGGSIVGGRSPLDEAALAEVAALPHVEAALGVVTAPVLVVPPADAGVPTFTDAVVGVDLSHLGLMPITVLSGRVPVPGSHTEIAVTEAYLARLGVRRADARTVVGTTVQLGAARAFGDVDDVRLRGRWTKATIVGVVAQDASDGQILVPIEEAVAARDWIAQSSDALVEETAVGLDAFFDEYASFFVVADDVDRVGEVRSAVGDLGYSTRAPERVVSTVARYLRVVETVLTGIGLISLLIAVLGVANAMLSAVRERRREIGVMKAVGLRDRDVRRVVLAEAAMLGVSGGVLGAVAGWLVARVVAVGVNRVLADEGLPGASVVMPWWILVGGVVGATVLAVVAGSIPARRAVAVPPRLAVEGM